MSDPDDQPPSPPDGSEPPSRQAPPARGGEEGQIKRIEEALTRVRRSTDAEPQAPPAQPDGALSSEASSIAAPKPEEEEPPGPIDPEVLRAARENAARYRAATQARLARAAAPAAALGTAEAAPPPALLVQGPPRPTEPSAPASPAGATPEPTLSDALRLMGAAVQRQGQKALASTGAGLAAVAGPARGVADRTRSVLGRASDAVGNRVVGVLAPVDPTAARVPEQAPEPAPEPIPQAAPEAAARALAAPRRPRSAPGARAIRFGWRLLVWSIFLLAFGAGATALSIWLVMRDLPLADILPPVAEPTVSVETADGQVLTTRGAYQAPYVALEEFPPHLVDAVLAVEDKRFWDHSGVDLRGITRALYRNASAGGVVEGGSTITQQLIKILYLEPERTITRKLQEAVLATTLERQLGKERILELYLNSVYLGSGAYGMPAAAETYYGKEVGELTLAEAATLAASIQLPSQVNPLTDLAAAQNRGGLVLSLMADQARIEEPQRDAALAELATLSAAPPPTRAGSYFADWVLAEVEDLQGASSEGMTATATLDPELQAQTEAIVRRIMAVEGAAAGASQAAVVVMTPTGRVRAMVGGLDYGTSEFNRATDALRQPGSTFKTFVYLAALVMGAGPDSTVSDAPIEIGDWSPDNFDGESHGTVTLRQAFAESYNQAAVRLAQAVGNDNIIEVATRLGIEAELQDTPSLALGPSEVTLLDMTEAFAAIALGRMPVSATGIETLSFGEEGEALGVTGVNDREQTRLTRTREPMLDLLRAVVAEGTGSRAAVEGLDIVGKTGTSQESRDAWFIGFAQGQGVVIGVWVGNDDNSPMDRVTGGGIPARIFHDVMVAAMARQGGVPASGASTGTDGGAAPALAAAEPARPQCDIRACSAAYRSFRAEDCTFQPYSGPRRLCTR